VGAYPPARGERCVEVRKKSVVALPQGGRGGACHTLSFSLEAGPLWNLLTRCRRSSCDTTGGCTSGWRSTRGRGWGRTRPRGGRGLDRRRGRRVVCVRAFGRRESVVALPQGGRGGACQRREGDSGKETNQIGSERRTSPSASGVPNCTRTVTLSASSISLELPSKYPNPCRITCAL
jgi:hypothetical protein